MQMPLYHISFKIGSLPQWGMNVPLVWINICYKPAFASLLLASLVTK